MEEHTTDGGEMGGGNLTRAQAIAELSYLLGMPVITVVSGWTGDRRVDLGEEALRAFLHVFDAETVAWNERNAPSAGEGTTRERCDEVAIFLVGRGGFPEFAQGVCRALRGQRVRATAVIPEQINGALALAALGMDQRLMHPYAAIGAYDCPALGGARGAPDADTLREIEVFQNLESSAAIRHAELLDASTLIAIAHQRRQARHARQLLGRLMGKDDARSTVDALMRPGSSEEVASALSARTLGTQLALCAAEINALGVSAQLASSQQAALIWRIFESYEQEFKVLHPAVPRYTQSEIADEVEFAPAMEISGAIIEGVHQKFVYELDTARPDPRSGMLGGAWSW